VTKAMQLGGRLIREYAEEGHVVMADPGRNEFCVIEPDADFLDGTGYLGEVTCEGPPNRATSGGTSSAGRSCGIGASRRLSNRRPAARRSPGTSAPVRPTTAAGASGSTSWWRIGARRPSG